MRAMKIKARTGSNEELLHRACHRSDHLVILVLDVIDEGFLQLAMGLS